MEQYKQTQFNAVIRLSDNVTVHFNPDLPEYQQYLADVEAGAVVLSDDTPLAILQAYQITRINELADREFAALTVDYPKLEVATWPNQYAEAKAFQADSAAGTPTLTAIAQHAGVPIQSLVAKVLQKSARFTVDSGVIIGKRKKAESVVIAATTPEDVKKWTW